MRILVLTKNILVEEDLQNKLQELNFEVFCTRNAFIKLLTENTFDTTLTLFDLVILSETLTNKEVAEVTKSIKKFNMIIIRKTADMVTKEEQNQISDCQLDGWISDLSSKDELRESLAKYNKTIKNKENDEDQTEDLAINYLEEFYASLSKHERQIFKKLYENKESCVLREELHSMLWPHHESAELNKPYLSAVIKRIRTKLKKYENVPYRIVTDYGSGYKLVA